MQSTCLVSVRVMTHSVNTSAPAERMRFDGPDRMRWRGRLRRASASGEREEEYRSEQEQGDGGHADAGECEWFAFSHFECFLPCCHHVFFRSVRYRM